MKNTCSCPHPPGGTVTCEADQVAYCSAVAGKTDSGCISVTDPTGTSISREEKLLSVLASIGFDMSSEFSLSVGGETVRFNDSTYSRILLHRAIDGAFEINVSGTSREDSQRIETRLSFPNAASRSEPGAQQLRFR